MSASLSAAGTGGLGCALHKRFAAFALLALLLLIVAALFVSIGNASVSSRYAADARQQLNVYPEIHEPMERADKSLPKSIQSPAKIS